MDFQRLEVLEEKIKKMISAMKVLQIENQHLSSKNQESERTINKLRLDLDTWSKSAEENGHLQEQIEALRKERDEIKSKVERLISHLEELETKI